jgi:TolB-like protein/DNA-binding winged helix-turn-helix (wHTH) protein/cytochrome c-type biogenesis protein CcmH/NrfG
VTYRYRFADLLIDAQNFRLLQEGKPLAIEPKALHLLIFLVQNRGRLVERQELLNAVWGDAFVTDHVLNRSIGQVRKVLGDDPKEPRYIETVPTLGYRFIAAVITEPDTVTGTETQEGGVPPIISSEGAIDRIDRVDRVDRDDSDNSAAQVIPPAWSARTESIAAPPSSEVSSRKSRTEMSRRKWLALAACLTLVTICVWWIWHRRSHEGEPIRSLAVLPLDDLSPGTREDYFADGLTDELITELSHIPGLRVVSRTSIMQEKGAHKPLAQLANELDVDAVVEGSVVRSGNRVRITAQLIDARSDKHLWAHTFEESSGDILSIQDNFVRQIAQQTSSILTPAAQAALTNAKHVSPEAHDDYLRGLYFIQRRDGDLAVSYFRKAIALQPDYAAANAGLAEALVTQMLANGERAAEIMPPAIAAARRAIDLDPSSGEAYTALGAIDSVYLYDWKAAEQNLRKGIELSPSSAGAETWYAVYLTSVGRPAEAVNAVQRAVALDPLSFWANRLLGSMLFYSRRYDESLAALKRAFEIAPDKAGYVQGWYSGIYELQGRYDDAFAADLEDLAPDLSPQDAASFRSAYQSGGWKAYQQARVKFLLPRSMNECQMNPIAMSYLRLGNLDETFRWFNRDMDNRCGKTIFDLSADPRLDAIRQDPRFTALRRRANLPN